MVSACMVSCLCILIDQWSAGTVSGEGLGSGGLLRAGSNWWSWRVNSQVFSCFWRRHEEVCAGGVRGNLLQQVDVASPCSTLTNIRLRDLASEVPCEGSTQICSWLELCHQGQTLSTRHAGYVDASDWLACWTPVLGFVSAWSEFIEPCQNFSLIDCSVIQVETKQLAL